jgi:hypothetical protein
MLEIIFQVLPNFNTYYCVFGIMVQGVLKRVF